MLANLDTRRKNWLFWVALVLSAGLVIWLAPEEETLGEGIRSVYVHVAFIWVGMASLAIAGLLGVGVVIFAHEKLSKWMQTIGWVGLAFYGAGVGMSILASKVNWGNVFWQEPRMRVALNMLVVVLIIEIAIGWIPWVRLGGLLSAGLVVLLGWSTMAAPLVLHPSNPIRTSSSMAIQRTFLALFLLCGLAAAWIVWNRRLGAGNRRS